VKIQSHGHPGVVVSTLSSYREKVESGGGVDLSEKQEFFEFSI